MCLNPSKSDLINNSIPVFDWDEGNSTESQLLFFNDAPWEAILKIMDYVKIAHNKTKNSIVDSLKSKYGADTFPDDWRKRADSEETVRSALNYCFC